MNSPTDLYIAIDSLRDSQGTRFLSRKDRCPKEDEIRSRTSVTGMVPGALDTGGSNQRSIRFADRGRDDDNFTYDGIDAMLATAEGGGTGGPQLRFGRVSQEPSRPPHPQAS